MLFDRSVMALNDYCTDERLDGPQTISLTKADLSKPNPKSGAMQLEWNKTGTLLLVRYGNDACFCGDTSVKSEDRECT